jgi:hypothetical protein
VDFIQSFAQSIQLIIIHGANIWRVER